MSSDVFGNFQQNNVFLLPVQFYVVRKTIYWNNQEFNIFFNPFTDTAFNFAQKTQNGKSYNKTPNKTNRIISYRRTILYLQQINGQFWCTSAVSPEN